MNIVGMVKDWLLIAFSWSVIKDNVTPINLFEYRLTFLGVAYYNHSKLQALKAKETQRQWLWGCGGAKDNPTSFIYLKIIFYLPPRF